MRCEMEYEGMTCGARAFHECEHCGPLCLNCQILFHCLNGKLHVMTEISSSPSPSTSEAATEAGAALAAQKAVVKHTPGPWRTEFCRCPYEIEAKVRGEVIVIAEVPDEIMEDDARADARLIAAGKQIADIAEAAIAKATGADHA